MCVPAGNAKDQVLAVFKHFNIQVNTSDIFSRCQVRSFLKSSILRNNLSCPKRMTVRFIDGHIRCCRLVLPCSLLYLFPVYKNVSCMFKVFLKQ